MEDQFAPPVCARIKATRDALRKQALDAGDKVRAREFTQEAMAVRLNLSLQGYRRYERDREPKHSQRQRIARALGLDPDYFEGPAEPVVSGEQLEQVVALLNEALGRLARVEGMLDAELRARSRRQRGSG